MNGEGRTFQIGGVEGLCYIDTCTAYTSVHNLSTGCSSAGVVEECDFSGNPWTAPGAEPTALEHEALGWYTPAEMSSLDFCPADAELLPVVFPKPKVRKAC